MCEEADPRAIEVLSRALASSSRATRLRAVAMLARVRCPPRALWLDIAGEDLDRAVRDTATIVSAWIVEPDAASWPDREDTNFDRVADLDGDCLLEFERSVQLRWEWEYAIEVWRGDGLLVGVFLSTSCREDDEHAKKVALGQAVLASSARGADRFEPAEAAAFIVGKQRVRRGTGHTRRAGPGCTV
jgi:hypothetical protein